MSMMKRIHLVIEVQTLNTVFSPYFSYFVYWSSMYLIYLIYKNLNILCKETPPHPLPLARRP